MWYFIGSKWITIGKKYTLAFWYRKEGTGVSYPILHVDIQRGSYNIFNPMMKTESVNVKSQWWKFYAKSFIAPETSIRFYIYDYSTSSVRDSLYVDMVYVLDSYQAIPILVIQFVMIQRMEMVLAIVLQVSKNHYVMNA